MRVILQRVKEASVSVDNVLVGKIKKGLCILVGFTQEDTLEDIEYGIKKILHLRIFEDEQGKMNKSILDIGGSILSISQFTLYADTKKGNRPSYTKAMSREEAIHLYTLFNENLKEQIETETGIFGADMLVEIKNDGPVTIFLDTKEK